MEGRADSIDSPSRLRLRRYHQYKFIVDGEWRHDETQPFMPDPLGNVNNWLFVRRPEGAGQSCVASARPALLCRS
jgi:hypothetical protein